MNTNRTRSLLRGAAAALALAVAVVGFTACDPNAAADCSTDCLEFVSVNDNADTMMIAHAGGGAFSEVTIYSDAARTKVVGYGQNFSLLAYPSVPITKSFQGLPVPNPVKTQLKPATTYYYKAKSSAHGSSTQTGSFKTKQRTVTFAITNVWVYDDSDYSGSGEITMEARINGGTASVVRKDLDWASGETMVNPGWTKSVSGVMNANTIQVRAWDDDCTFSTCTAPSGAWDEFGGNGDTQWSTLTFPVTVTAPNMQYGYGTFTGNTHNGGASIGFYVEGTWQVQYTFA